MNAPKTILDQRITNWPSETWLREMADLEHEADEAPFLVYSSASAVLDTPPARVALLRRTASTDAECVDLTADELLAE